MIIRYTHIEHEREHDAPFMGALISSIDCNFNCKYCFNQELKQYPKLQKDSKDIMMAITNNKFNQGIILGGLEWTLQPYELSELLKTAKAYNLQTMLYTGMDFYIFKAKFNKMFDDLDYIKCGRYMKNLKTDTNIQYNIKLASSNQKIYKKGVDYL